MISTNVNVPLTDRFCLFNDHLDHFAVNREIAGKDACIFEVQSIFS
jgi:hypothetical protein